MATDAVETIGIMVNRLLDRHGWTQAQLGREIGVEGKTISRWVCGTRTPGPERVAKMEKLLAAPDAQYATCGQCKRRWVWLIAGEERQYLCDQHYDNRPQEVGHSV